MCALSHFTDGESGARSARKRAQSHVARKCRAQGPNSGKSGSVLGPRSCSWCPASAPWGWSCPGSSSEACVTRLYDRATVVTASRGARRRRSPNRRSSFRTSVAGMDPGGL